MFDLVMKYTQASVLNILSISFESPANDIALIAFNTLRNRMILI
jgi:hypothetical protein